MIRPLGERIIVKKDPQGPLTVGGILIPQSAERTPRFAPTILGTVLGVGTRVKILKVGDRIALKIYAGDEFFHENDQFSILRERDIIGVVHE